jgi:hypothetical protein
MSSRGGGPRTAGTDGSDHAFRQTVDIKYKKAAVARKNITKTFRMLFAYYPIAGAFAIGPALAMGNPLDIHNVPFAAVALLGSIAAVQASKSANAKTFHAKRLEISCRFLCVFGIFNLVAGASVRLLTYEDKRMAWVFSEFVTDNEKGILTKLNPGVVYPFAVSLELLLEIVGAVIPLGSLALARALATYAQTKTN